ncbi:amino acid adenylation domain-containing protein [Streptomyces canus]|uniref:amino acid adenylation domain-containing protein n=1 Tax=Streptomyces canus TaxID=58343 RepID=UPI0030E19015
MSNVEDIYKLAPLQSGMLFHVLDDSAGENPYVAQSVEEFVGPLDVQQLRAAWQAVVDRHTALRSSFVWEGLHEPLQVVQRQAEVPFQELDWRGRSAPEQKRLMERLLADDRSRGFDLSSAPLMRFTVIRSADHRTLVMWSFHHLLLDGWSAQLVQKDFYELYRSGMAGEAPGLPAPVPYSRYIGWLQEQSAADAEVFWRRRLDGFSEPTELGIDRDTGLTGFADHMFQVNGEHFTRLREFARSNHLTMNTIVQGLWALLLSRYGSSEDVLFGATVSGRPADLPDMERMVGLFINTLPVRMAVPHEARLVEWLKGVQDQHAELRQYEYSSLVDVQAWSDVPRDESLFRSILIFENYPKLLGGVELPEGLRRQHLLYVERTGYPLVIGVSETPAELDFHVVYDRSLFEASSVERLAGHLCKLLESTLGQVDVPLSALEMLTTAELEQLSEWNGNTVEHPTHVAVHQLIERQARLRPDAVALSFGSETLTYSQLNARANQLARYLRIAGVRPEVVVGLCFERGLDMIVALLGILKSGGAYVPLDQEYPTERLAFMLQDTDAPVIVTQRHLAGRLPAEGRRIVCMDADWAEIDCQPFGDPEPLAGPENLAYVIYTSGSTGTPKGVMIEHRSMSDRVQEMQSQYELTANDRYLQFSSVTFDGSVGEIFPTLIAGAELVLRGDDWTPAWIMETIRSKEITVCQLPPFVWNELTSQMSSSLELGDRLRLMSMGGERVLPAPVKRWFQRTSIPLFNIYGPTETTVNMTTCLITEPPAIVSIGRPVANADVLVVDNIGRQVPIGVAGELWIGGVGVARGYLNQPELTAERFVPHPFADDPNRRMYRTGDLVRWLPDGNLDILGRIDDQVKLRGFRIELGEVESALLSHPDVVAGVVGVRDDDTEGKRLVAYCVPAAGGRLRAAELRQWCERSLPNFMVPSAYVFLDALPSTANGKAVDRKALPAPDGVRLESETEFVSPAPGTEELIASIWQEVLKIERIGAHDNFFALGGDSFQSIQVIARARKNGIRITPRVIFQNPTVAAVARQVDVNAAYAAKEPAGRKTGGAEAEPRGAGRSTGWSPTRYGLSPMQSGMLFHVLHDPVDVNPYVGQSVDEFVGPLDVPRFREAWKAVVDRHTALRSSIAWEGLDEPQQVVHERVELPFAELDWRGCSEAEQQRLRKRLLTEDRARGFDLSAAPLLRFTLVRLAETRSMLIWSFHHMVLDGWSAQLVQTEAIAQYRAALEGDAPRLDPPVPYARYIDWLSEQPRAQTEGFWRRYLEGFKAPTELGTGRPTGETGFDDVEIELDATQLTRLNDFSRAHKITLNTVIQGAWALLLARYSGNDDVVYGSTVSGRQVELPEAQSMVGLFINTLPVRARVPADARTSQWLQQFQGQLVELRQYEYSALSDVQAWSATPKRERLFQSILVVQNHPRAVPASGLPQGLTVEHGGGEGRTGYPLTVVVTPEADRLSLIFSYDRSVVDRATVERMAGHFGMVLTSMAHDPDVRLGELEMLTEAERRQVVEEWNDTATGPADDGTLHGLVQAQAQERPTAAAVVFGTERLSYGELNERANRLARVLRGRGVGPDVLVGVCLERGVDMVVALLAVLKAGAAYVPLDPEYPEERLAFILADTAAPVVVTRSGLRQRLAAGGFDVVSLDTDRESIAQQSAADLESLAGSDDLAYVIYTSGSTGTPKGVEIRHRSVLNRFHGTDGNFAFGPQDVWTLFHSFTFDFSVWEIWGALTYGGCLVVVDQDTTRNAAAFMDLLIDQRVTVLNQTPSAFGLLQQVVGPDQAGKLSLRLVIFGGEALQPARLRSWWEVNGEAGPRLVNMYGITETTVHVTARDITVADIEAGTVSPIGRPLADTQVFVLDAWGQPVPIGVAGELWVGGAGLARGYLNRPELTAERFVQREIGGRVRRLYRSGDLARRLGDGELEYLGRLDDQVKVRGFRIELGEIESVLAAHPDVTATAVLAREDTTGDRRLVGYVVSTDGAVLTAAGLREWCARSLPEHMLPGAFVVLEALPLTVNGKVDRRALPAPEGARLETGTEYEAPDSPAEEAIARVWSEVLGVGKVGVNDNFFELGGDSILSIQVISRAKRYGLHLTPRMIFRHQTVASIAAHAEQGSIVRADQGKVRGNAGLTPIQRWFFELNLPQRGHFNQSRLLASESLVPEVLGRALTALVEQHDALRLRYKHGSSGWTQAHSSGQGPVVVESHDLSDLPEADLWNRMSLHADELHRGIDLGGGPLVRAALFELGAGRGQRLLLVVHHLVVDGVSWRILLEDLGNAYGSLVAGERVVLPMKTTSYQTWSHRLQSYASTEDATRELEFWTRPHTDVILPRDLDGDNTHASFDSVTVSLDSEETAALLRDVPRTFDVRINDVLLTAVAQAVRTWTGSPAVPVALEGHGREDLFDDVDLSRTVGWFTSIFPIELRLPSQAGPVELLASVRDQLAAVPNRGVGYGILRYLGTASIRNNLRAAAWPEISFNYLGQFDDTVAGLGRSAGNIEPSGTSVDPAGRRPHLLDIGASVQSGRMSLSVSYSRNIHEARTARRIAENVLAVLRSLIQAAHERGEAEDEPATAGRAYELTPMQAGMLYHSMADTVETDEVRPYVVQMVDEFTGPLDYDSFRRGWQEVVNSHTILRSAFLLDDEGNGRQLVRPTAALPFTEVDWRDTDGDTQRQRLVQLLEDDRRSGFDLARPPLMRFTLARMAGDRTVVLWSFHHLLLDGWSAQLVQREFYARYRSTDSGTADGLSPAVPYARYLDWLARRSQAEAEEFWRRRLNGFTTPTALGVDRETGLTGFGDTEFTVGSELSARLGEFAKANRLTVNTVLQGVWALLLSRYSGSEDVLYGSTVSGRPADLPAVESMVGLFINTLPVRTAVPANTPVLEWLRTLQDEHVELRQYEYSSLADIQRWSDVPANEKLFSSILIFENYPKLLSGADLPDGLTRRRIGYVERTGYPLVLGAAYADDLLHMHLVHDRSLIDDSTARRMAAQLPQLLDGIIAAGPGDEVGSLHLLTESDHAQLAAWNGPDLPHEGEVSVHELIERQAQERPNAPAVEFDDETLTYGQLNERANQLAHRLRALGAGPEVMVGLCLERGLDMMVALLGILKSGGAYVPLDTQYPAERLAFMIEDTALPVVVTQQHLSARLPASVDILCLDREADTALLDSAPVTDPEPLAGPDDLAYVIYTSGSTGRPKGVMIEHRSMSDRVQEMRRQYGLTPDDAYLQFSSVTFDGSVGEIFPTLIAGARLVPRGDDWTPVEVLETLRTKDITVCQLPPFVWNELIPHLDEGARPGPRLRLMSMGGERVLATSVERWFRRTSVPLFNIYGPTETTVNMTTCLLTGPEAVVPIGTPVANTDVLVVDGTGRPAPIGAPGELWIGGKGVARGYLNRPELTAERFVRDPRAEGAAGRMYRTGDLVRWLPDGRIDFIGRIDDQVKLRGFRIELGEIESTLGAHPGLTAAVVLLREDEPGARRLVAYCIAANGDRPAVSDLREWCARGLPDFMIPSVFTFLDALPVTANGKGVDRKALPAPGEDRAEVATRYVAPATPTEELLAGIWREVLKVDRVGADDNFFELGGDSFLGMQVIALARRGGVRITPRLLFQNPTITDLAARATTKRAGASKTAPDTTGEPSAGQKQFAAVGALTADGDTRVSTVELNRGTAPRTLFAFHEGGGNVSGYVHLAEALAPTVRVVGIEARSVAFDAPPQNDVAAMARGYWEAIRTLQPEGPYLLAGYSFGGALAIEVTRLIEESGGSVALLVGLDSCLPVSESMELVERDHTATTDLLARLTDAAEGDPERSEAIASLMLELNLPADMLALRRGELLDHLRTMEAHTRALLRYRPAAVSCPVLLYQAESSPWSLSIADSWSPFVTELDARLTRGDHLTFLRASHVGVMADEIAKAIEQRTESGTQ